MSYSSEGIKPHQSSVPRQQEIAAFEMKHSLLTEESKYFQHSES